MNKKRILQDSITRNNKREPDFLGRYWKEQKKRNTILFDHHVPVILTN